MASMATAAQPLLLLLLRRQQQRLCSPAWGLAVAAVAVLASVLVLLPPASAPLRRGAPPAELLELSVVAGAKDKGAVCLDGTPAGYHLQRGSGDGSNSWIIHLQDISGERSFWSVYDGVVHLQNVREVLPKNCVAKKKPTGCFFPAELIKSISTPMFILNSGYDSWQVQNVLVPNSSAPDEPWLNCKDNIQNCNSTQIEFLDGSRNTMVDAIKVVGDKEGWGLFVHSCFTHCQTVYDISWNSPMSPRLGNKTIAEAVGDWYHERNHGTKRMDCEYPCNPTCSRLLPT